MNKKTKFKQTEIGKIPEDWNVSNLAEHIEVMGGGTPKTTIKEYWNGEIPWISVVDFVGDQRWIFQTEKCITKKGLENSSTKLLHKGQLVISARGTVGELGQVTKDMAFNQSCYGIDGRGEFDNDYLYYLLKQRVKEFQQKSHGAVFNTITKETFNLIMVPIPRMIEQKTIAKVLSDMDSKILLNKQINKTLEAIGEAIFERWFVDFEFPNEEGKPYKSSGGKMIYSEEIGKELPETWSVGKYSDLVDVFAGKGLKRDGLTEDGKYAVLGANGKLGRTNEFLLDERLILTGRVGTLGQVYLSSGKAWISDNVLISRPKSEENYHYAYFTLKSLGIESLNRGSTQPLVTQTDLKNQVVVLPEKKMLVNFQRTMNSLYDKVDMNNFQIAYLSQIRDVLLPKLMSGKVRVSVPTENVES